MAMNHKATPNQWATVERWAVQPHRSSFSSVILELRGRVEALEATQHAHADVSRLSDAERQPVPVSERLHQMEDLAADAVAALRYIEESHGRLYGVGWDRVYEKADRLNPAHALPLPGEAAPCS